jgi:hypothetical protein
MLYTDPVTNDLADDYTQVYEFPAQDARFETKAFHWGGLTSGSPITALWILLAPFVLANAAGWMAKRKNRFGWSMIRAAGIGLTCLLTVQAVTVAVLIPYTWLAQQPGLRIGDMSFSVGTNTLRIVVVLLFLVLARLFYLLVERFSTRSHFAARLSLAERRALVLDPSPRGLLPEAVGKGPAESADPWADPAGARITDERLWLKQSILNRLRRLHLAAGLLTIALAATVWTAQRQVMSTVLVMLLLTFLATIAVAFRPANRIVVWSSVLAPLLSIIALVAATATVVTTPVGQWQPDQIHRLTFATAGVLGIFALLSIAAGGLTVGALVIATQFGAILGIAIGVVVESILGVSVLIENGAAWVSVAMLLLIVLIFMVGLVLSACGQTEPAKGATKPLPDRSPEQRSRRLLFLGRRAELEARFIFYAAASFGFSAFLAVAILVWKRGTELREGEGLPAGGLGGMVRSFLSGFEPGVLGAPTVGGVVQAIAVGLAVVVTLLVLWRLAVAWSMWAIVLVPVAAGLAAVALSTGFLEFQFLRVRISITDLVSIALAMAILFPGAFMLKSIWSGWRGGTSGEDRRRKVGILWDLGSFWPRWFHPLGPPAYGPKVINDLREMLEQQPQKVLAAHSQGSLIAAVAIHCAGDDGVVDGLITYGSQLGILYPRMFPATGIDELVDSVAARVSTWINLWRDTDPIGGHFVDRPNVDNRVVVTDSGHSGYETTPEYQMARRNVVGIEAALGPQPPDGQ